MSNDEPCVCATPFTCLADEHDTEAPETPCTTHGNHTMCIEPECRCSCHDEDES